MRYTINIVDDEETIRDGLSMILAVKYKISTFADVESFLTVLNNHSSDPTQNLAIPDLILMDIGLFLKNWF